MIIVIKTHARMHLIFGSHNFIPNLIRTTTDKGLHLNLMHRNVKNVEKSGKEIYNE